MIAAGLSGKYMFQLSSAQQLGFDSLQPSGHTRLPIHHQLPEPAHTHVH